MPYFASNSATSRILFPENSSLYIHFNNMNAGTTVIRIPGAISMIKSLKLTPSLASSAYLPPSALSMASGDKPEPIIIFGGSPIIVAAPPMLENKTSAMSIGTGCKSNTFANCIVTGVSSNTVVTLSKNADSTAVTIHKITTNDHIEPSLFLYASTANHSKTPVWEMTPTITIIPSSKPIVSQSIIVVTAFKLRAGSTVK